MHATWRLEQWCLPLLMSKLVMDGQRLQRERAAHGTCSGFSANVQRRSLM